VIKECYHQGWIDDETAWLNMLKDRNLTSHTYVQELALEIHARLPTHLGFMQVLAAKLGSIVAPNR
jgi:nucleotidyltransferase substrate binding protein (TIGR01987 family)